MSKERIFELVRNEELILFIGAGMSLYAGYPSGAALAKILHENLPSDLKEEITLTWDLSVLAEDIYQVKGKNKNYLLETIKKEFDKAPVDLTAHKLLAQIPHFKTIITTNYDDLIETTNKQIDVIRKNSDCAYLNNKKQSLFKIHGDFTDKGSIILTQSDYIKYFSQDKTQTVFWNTVKNRLASNHILFVGYSLEDSNILTIIDKILDELGEHRKEMYFVAPEINRVKLKTLQNKGIEFIESKGEDLIAEIYDDLRLNYFTNLKTGQGTADTALHFAKENDLNLSIKYTDNNIDLDIPNNIDLDFEVKFQVEMPLETSKGFNDFINGKSFEPFVFSSEEIKKYNLFLKNFRIKDEKLAHLELRKAPSFSDDVDIVFEDGYELESFPLEIFVIWLEENVVSVKLVLDCFEMIFTTKNSIQDSKINIQTTISQIKPIRNIRDGIRFYEAVLRFTTNMGFKVYKKSELLYSNKFNITEKDWETEACLEYLNALKLIERHFNVRFLNIDFEESEKDILEEIMSFITQKAIKRKFLGINIKNKSEEEIGKMLELEEGVIIISEREPKVVTLHGIDFNVGFVHQVIYDGYGVNFNEVIAKETDVVHLKSKTDSVYIMYSEKETICTSSL